MRYCGFAGKFGAQIFALRRDAGWAGIQVTLTRHIAAERDEAGGAKAKFFRAKHSANHHIASGFEATIDAHFHTPAQSIVQQHLLRLRQPELPGNTGMLDGLHGRGSGAAIMTANEDIVGVGFSDARRDSADAKTGNQLDADTRLWVDLAQVIDQLGQVFDAIDVVMRRRRDERHARGGMAQFGDKGRDLAGGQLPTLARF